MSLFSFGSSRHSTFHAKITIHELDNVPLLDGAFQVRWKVSNAHSLPPGFQTQLLSSVTSGNASSSPGSHAASGTATPNGGTGTPSERERKESWLGVSSSSSSSVGDRRSHHHHHHHQHHQHHHHRHQVHPEHHRSKPVGADGHARHKPHHHSQQLSAKDLPADLLTPENAARNGTTSAVQTAEDGLSPPDDGTAKKKSRRARQFASDPGLGTAGSSEDAEQSGWPAVGQRSGEDDWAEAKNLNAQRRLNGLSGSSSTASFGYGHAQESTGETADTGITIRQQQPDADATALADETVGGLPEPRPTANRQQLEEEAMEQLTSPSPFQTKFGNVHATSSDSLSVGSLQPGETRPEGSQDGKKSRTTSESSASSKPGRFARFLHGLSGSARRSKSGSRSRSVSPSPALHSSSAESPPIERSARVVSVEPESITSSATAHSRQRVASAKSMQHSHTAEFSRNVRGRPSSSGSAGLGISSSPRFGPLRGTHGHGRHHRREPSPPISATIDLGPSALADDGSKDAGRSLRIDQPLTPGLDILRDRESEHLEERGSPSLSKKPSSSRLSVASAGASSNFKNFTGGKGKERESPPSSQAHGASSASAHASGSTGLEAKGATDIVPVKDHVVRWERTFEVGIRVPVEKYKHESHNRHLTGMLRSGSSSSLSLNTFAASFTGTSADASPVLSASAGGSIHNGHSGSSGGTSSPAGALRKQRSKGSVRAEYEAGETDKELERERELAEAWGILGRASLRMQIRQDVETEASPAASSHTQMGFVELNLAEFAPWPSLAAQAQALAPHMPIPHALQRLRAKPMHRTETRRYLLRESKTNARLKITIELTLVSGAREFAVPRIRRGLPVHGVGDYAGVSVAAQKSFAMRQSFMGQSHLQLRSGDPSEEELASLCSGASSNSRPSLASSSSAVDGWGSHTLSGTYGEIMLGTPETTLRSTIPSKNLRSVSGNSASSNKLRSSASSARDSSSFVDRDPTNVIDMIFDQAKANVQAVPDSAASSIVAAESDVDAEVYGSRMGAHFRAAFSFLGDSSKLGAGPSSAKRPFFRSRKLSNNRQIPERADTAMPPITGQSSPKLRRTISSSSLSSLAASASVAMPSVMGASLLPPEISSTRSLSASPEPLSRVTSRASQGTATSHEKRPQNQPELVSPPHVEIAPHDPAPLPSIDISSPGGSMLPAFDSLAAQLASPDMTGAEHTEGATLDALSADLRRPALRRFRSDPAAPELHSAESNEVTPVKSPDGTVSTDAKPRLAGVNGPGSRPKQLKGHRGITPEQATLRGFRGAGWQETQFASVPQDLDHSSSVVRLDLPDARFSTLSRQSSGDSSGSDMYPSGLAIAAQ